MAMMNDSPRRVFIDNNILIYATQETAPWNPEARRALQAFEEAGSELWLSRQVLREYIAALSRPQTYATPLDTETIVQRVRLFQQIFHVADDTAEVTSRLLALLTERPAGGKQVHDANVAATMLAYDIDALLTANVADFRRFEGLFTLLPLTDETP